MSLKGYLKTFCKKSVATHILLFLLVISANTAFSQASFGYKYTHVIAKPISVFGNLDEEPPKDRGPRKATILSAVFPGAGQIYNKKYWKLPIIYGGMGTLIYFIKDNADEAKKYEKAYNYSVDGDSNTDPASIDKKFTFLTSAAFRQERDEYRDNRDLSILLLAAVYALQIIDANVDAHLKEFDVGDDLSMRIKPKFDYNPYSRSFSQGIKLTLNIKQKPNYRR